MMIEGNDKPGFKIDLHIKDLNNALDCAHSVGAPVPMTAEVQEILQWMHNHEGGQKDHSAIAQSVPDRHQAGPLKRGTAMNTDFIKGVVVPILTIVDEDEKIDEARQRAQVDYVIEGGVTGILAFGSNGEFCMLEADVDAARPAHHGGPGGRACTGLLRHRCHQYQKVLPSGKDGGGKQCSGGQRRRSRCS